MDLPRKEYPRPQFERKNWINLNGEWTFRFDFGGSGAERKWNLSKGFEQKIIVPFCPESRLSTVEHTDFISEVWYHRKVVIPKEWEGKKILFHCAGIDYESEIYLDGTLAGKHTGGVSPVETVLDRFVKCGEEQDLVIRVKDDPRSDLQPLGKQSRNYGSSACTYTRVTGIWQTVWLEAVSPQGLHSCHIVPDYDGGAFSFQPEFFEQCRGNRLHVRILDNGVCAAEKDCAASNSVFSISLADPKEWNPETPFLYEIEFTVLDRDGKTVDQVFSYAGLRKFHTEGDKLFLNNRPVYLRFVLDQGFYPDGLWTAPSDEALKKDIELSKAAGFNGARLHQRIFEERFHYWADRLGYLTWSEFPDWGIGFWQHFTKRQVNFHHCFRDYYAQWNAIVARDRNHPSIIAWTPFNETARYMDLEEHRRFLQDIYDLTKNLDPTRPVNDSSGYTHAKTDLWTAHNYSSKAEDLQACLDREPVYFNFPDAEAEFWHGQPFLMDEYGGVSFLPPERKAYAENSWGYGGGILHDAETVLERIRSLTEVLLKHRQVQGYCYTQLTDIEQEQNGIYYYDRTPKFDMARIRKIFGKKPDWSIW